MNNSRSIRELFARLFVMAVQNKVNLSSFTYLLSRSVFVAKIENGQYDDYFNKPLEQIFYDVTGNKVDFDNSYGVFDDAYWCGYAYYEIHLRTKKPFAYIFMKLPLNKLMDTYPVYHEMDISSLLEYFAAEEKKKTILRLLCEQNKTSLAKLSASTGIGLATLSKYNASDDSLYKGSFQNVIRIANTFNAPVSLFANQY